MTSDDIDLNADGGAGNARREASVAEVTGPGGVVAVVAGLGGEVVGGREEEGGGGGGARRDETSGLGVGESGIEGSGEGGVAGETAAVGVSDPQVGEVGGVGTSDEGVVEAVEEVPDAGGQDPGTVEVEVVDGGKSAVELPSLGSRLNEDDVSVLQGDQTVDGGTDVGTKHTDVNIGAPWVEECKVPMIAEPSEGEHEALAEIKDLGGSGSCEAAPPGTQPTELVGQDISPGGRDLPALEHAVSESQASAPNESSTCEKGGALNPDCGDVISGIRDGIENYDTEEPPVEGLKKTDVEAKELLENAEEPSVNHGIAGLGTSHAENDESAFHLVPDEREDEFSISDLVWGKIKSHPWWPGQIVDPSNASEMALKHQRKDNFLVAYFGDKTFAWCDESQLRPFKTFFSQMEKQSSSEVFLDAVSDAVEEVSRRVQLAMMCPCVPEKSYSKLKYQLIENAGIRQGVSISVSDRSLGLLSFRPSEFLGYINSLAKFPTGTADKMVLSIAQAQLVSFYRSKGCTRLHIFLSSQYMAEGGIDAFPSEGKKHAKETAEHLITVLGVTEQMPSAVTSRRGRPKSRGDMFHKQRNISEDGRKQRSLSELMEDGKDAHLMNEHEGDPRNKVAHKPAIHHGDMESKHSSLSLNKSFKLGECIRRVATKLISSSPIPECNGETNQKSTVMKIGPDKDNPFSLDVSPPSPEQIQMIKSIILEDCSSLSEMLSQLCTAAIHPIEKYDFLSTTIKFFTEIQRLRDSIALEALNSPGKVGRKRGRPKSVSNSGPAEHVKLSENVGRKRGRPKSLPECPVADRKLPEKTGRKRGRPKKVPSSNPEDDKKTDHEKGMKKPAPLSDLPEMSVPGGPDHMKDSYWTDMVVHSNPEKKRRGRKRKEESLSQSLPKKSKPIGEPSKFLLLSAVSDIPQHMLPATISCTKIHGPSSSRQIKYFGKKCVEECTPTALILSFSNLDSVPSRTDLMRIFSRYGPLKEAEVSVKTKCATVVFKKQADAEAAFSSAGKCSVFGPSLLSYRLKNVPSISENSPQSTPVDGKHSTSIDGNTDQVSDNINVEEPVPNLHLEVAGDISDEKSVDSRNINVLNQKSSTSMEICTVEVAVAENDELSNGGNFKVPSSSRVEVHGHEKDVSLVEVAVAENDELSNGGNFKVPSSSRVEVQGHEKDVSLVDDVYLEVLETKPDELPMNSCDKVGFGDAGESADRGVHSGALAHGEMSVSGVRWEITNTMLEGSFMDSDHLDALAKNIPTHMETCNVETPDSEKDTQPLDGGHLKVLDGKPDEAPIVGVCLEVLQSTNDSPPVDAGNLDAQCENRDEAPSDEGNIGALETNLDVITPMNVGGLGDSEDPEIKGNCNMVVQGEKQASSHKLEVAGPIVDERPMDSGSIEVQAKDTLEPMKICDPEVPVTEKDILPLDVVNLKVLDSKPHEASPDESCLDANACDMEAQGCKKDDTLAADGTLEVLDIKPDETLMVSNSLVGFGDSEDPAGIRVCGMLVKCEKSVNPLNSELTENVVVDRPIDSNSVEILSEKDLELVDIRKADAPVAEKDKLPLEGANLKVLDYKSPEASADSMFEEVSNSTKDPACADICDLEVQGREGDNTPGGSVLEVLGMEQDQAIKASGDMLGYTEEDPGTDCLVVHQIESDASHQDFNNADVLDLKNSETSTCSGNMDVSEAKENPVSLDIGVTQLPGGGSECTLSYGAESDIVVANTDNAPVYCGNAEVSVSEVDETPKDGGRNEEGLVSKTCETFVDSTNKEISEKYVTSISKGHVEARECGGISQNRGSPNAPAEGETT